MFFIFWTIVLAVSLHKDRSRYRNCYLFAAAFLSGSLELLNLLRRVSFLLPLLLLSLLGILIMSVPALMILNGVQMMKKEGRSLANLLSFLMGIGMAAGEVCGIAFAAIVLYAAAHEISIDWMTRPVYLLLLLICFSAIYFSVSFLAFLAYTVFLEIIPKKRDFDYVIIHGAGLLRGDQISKLLADRLDKAIAVYHKDPTPPVLIPSGGQGKDETISEARAMGNYLREHGIPEEHILEEDQSMTTMENLINSKKLIEERPGAHYTALVTNNYHVYRALRYCRKINFSCTGIGAHVAAYYWPSALIREYVAIHKEPKHLITLILGWLLLILAPLILLLIR